MPILIFNGVSKSCTYVQSIRTQHKIYTSDKSKWGDQQGRVAEKIKKLSHKNCQ